MGLRFLHLISFVHRKEGTVMFPASRVLLLFGRTGDRDCYSNRAGRHSQKRKQILLNITRIACKQSLCHCHCHSYSNSPSQSITQLIHFSTQNLEIKINRNRFEFTKLPEFIKSAGPLILPVHNIYHL